MRHSMHQVFDLRAIYEPNEDQPRAVRRSMQHYLHQARSALSHVAQYGQVVDARALYGTN